MAFQIFHVTSTASTVLFVVTRPTTTPQIPTVGRYASGLNSQNVSSSAAADDERHGMPAPGAIAFQIRNILHMDGAEDSYANEGKPCPCRGACRDAEVQAGVGQVPSRTAGVGAAEIVVRQSWGHERDARDRELEVLAQTESSKARAYHDAEGHSRGDMLGRYGTPGLVGAVLEHGFRVTGC